MLKLIGISNCNTIKKTKNWLTENKVPYLFRDVKKEPLDPVELAELVKKTGLETLVNKKSRTWKTLKLHDKVLSDSDLFEVLLMNQTLIKRPVLWKEEAVLAGYDEDAFSMFVGEHS